MEELIIEDNIIKMIIKKYDLSEIHLGGYRTTAIQVPSSYRILSIRVEDCRLAAYILVPFNTESDIEIRFKSIITEEAFNFDRLFPDGAEYLETVYMETKALHIFKLD